MLYQKIGNVHVEFFSWSTKIAFGGSNQITLDIIKCLQLSTNKKYKMFILTVNVQTDSYLQGPNSSLEISSTYIFELCV